MNDLGADFMQRYFHGDLDELERVELDRKLNDDPAFRTRFDEEYDRRTETLRFRAFTPTATGLEECFSPETLGRFARGELSDEARAIVEAHLACPLCRAQLEAAGAGEEAPASAATMPPRWTRRRSFAWGSATSLVAVACVLLLVRAPSERFQERGSLSADRQAWMRIQTLSEQQLAPLGAGLDPSQELVFSVSTSVSSPYTHLAIAALDSAGRAHWYYPAYEHFEDDPVSISVDSGWGDRELGHRISLSTHASGPMEICAMFTREPLRVRDVDAQLEAEGRWPAGVDLDCVRVELGSR